MTKTFSKTNGLMLAFLTSLMFFAVYTWLPFPYGIVVLLGGFVVLWNFKYMESGAAVLLLGIPFLPNTLTILLIGWLLFLYVRNCVKEEDIGLKPNKKTLPFLLLWGIMVLATLFSTDFRGSLRDLLLHSLAFLVVVILIQIIQNKRQFYNLLGMICYASALVSLYGIFQYIVGVELDASWVDQNVNPDLQTRVFSFFGNPNVLAEYLILVTPLCFAFLFGDPKPFQKLVFGGIFLLNSLVILLTFSRGGWVGFALAMCLFLLLVDRRFIWALIPLGIIGFFVLPESIRHRILTIFNTKDSSNNYRLNIWKYTLEMIQDHFFNGVGLGYLPFKSNYLNYIRTMNVYHAHNMYLEIFAEMGIAGILTFLVVIGNTVKDGLKAIKRHENRLMRFLQIGILSGLSAVLAHGLFENILYMPRIILMFWIMVAFCIKGAQLAQDIEK